MTPLTFAEFYEHVTGYRPYNWQKEVSASLSRNEWHDSLCLPTGTGKTGLIEIWCYNLFHQMMTKSNRTMPMRCYWIINRRTIVDDVWNHARRLQRKVTELFPTISPLEVFRLRGGNSAKENNCSLNPAAPALYISTLDSYGSRLLFRSYGCGTGYRSVHAGLAFFDSLVVLDESHLTKPLSILLNRVKEIQGERLPGILLPHVVKVSATEEEGSKFPVKDLHTDQKLVNRLGCKKTIQFEEVTTTLPRKVKTLINEAIAANHRTISVVCNTVNNARMVMKELQSIKNKDLKTYLLIGPSRPYNNDRRKFLQWWLKNRQKRTQDGVRSYLQEHKKVLNDKTKCLEKQFRVVVSTQTIEVGVDYDFDYMISEIADLASLIQRAGRLARDGTLSTAEFICLHPPITDTEDQKELKKFPIYGKYARDCLKFLQGLKEEEKIFPFPQENRPASRPADRTIHLTDADVERLVITNPNLSFNIEPYIKGVGDYDTDVLVVWRNWLDEKMLGNARSVERDRMVETLKVTGIKPAEIVRVPLPAILTRTLHVADCESINKDTSSPSRLADKPCVIRRCGKYYIKGINEARPGDILILPSNYGGLDKWGWNLDHTDKVIDVYNRIRSGKVYFHGKESKTFNDLKSKLKKFKRQPGEFVRKVVSYHQRKEQGYIVLLGAALCPKSLYDYASDQSISSLEVHTERVVDFVQKFIKELGLHAFKEDFITAAKFHDLGKADWRFQIRMYGQNFPNPQELLAKPKDMAGPHIQPLGWRHELASLQILLDSNCLVSELAYHLIGSHHGRHRPYAKILLDNNHQYRKFNLVGKDWESKNPFVGFENKLWYILNDKYGPWGLAFLETIFRLADGRASCSDCSIKGCNEPAARTRIGQSSYCIKHLDRRK